jgi:5-methylcytosine-specific restriction endonuclease McrA
MTSAAGQQPPGRTVMRSPCSGCGCLDGTIATKGGQDVVRCADCDRFCYNAPRTETGREPRSLRTRPTIRPRQRARILLRDNSTCVLCHRHGVPLDVGHMISVDDGHALGLSDAELGSDENLAAMCASCNSGLGSETLPLRIVVAVLRARSARATRRPA